MRTIVPRTAGAILFIGRPTRESRVQLGQEVRNLKHHCT